MIALNEVKSDMADSMGQSVPKIKAIVSHDTSIRLGHNVPMDQDDEKIAETAWRQGFRKRLKEARGKRSQKDMAGLLCISRDAYSKYEGARASAMPTRLLPKFAKICGIDLVELIEGPAEPRRSARPVPAPPRRRSA